MSSIPAITSRVGRHAHPIVQRTILAVLALAVSGCGSGGLPASGAPASPPASAPASLQPASAPASSASQTSPVPSPAGTPRPTEQPGPPVATLVVAGGAPVTGALGSYVWDGAGSDSPWIVPPPDDAVQASAPFAVMLVPPLAIGRWEAAWAPVEGDAAGDPRGSASGDGVPVAVPAPGGVGTWSLKVGIRFADGNHAVWYWRVEVLP